MKLRSFVYQGYKYYVVDTIHDGDTELYVLKYWRKYNHHYWVYGVWERLVFDDKMECGLLKNVKYEKA